MKTVWTNGCFDILTAAHCDFLKRCSLLGERLIVGLNTDASIKMYKGNSRPFVAYGYRKLILESLRCVDEVVPIDSRYPTEVITRIKPNIVVKGLSYSPESMPEYDAILGYGGMVVFLPELGISSSDIIERIQASAK